jgi:hypothetical protein
VVLDPPVHSLVAETYYSRPNLRLACASGICLLTFDDQYVNGVSNTGAVRFDANLNILGGGLFTLEDVPMPMAALESNGSLFYTVRYQQQLDGSMVVTGGRVTTGGQKLDGNGVDISGLNEPQAFTVTGVVWDGNNWKVSWGHNNQLRLARINSAGQVLDPGGVAVPGPLAGWMAATPGNGLQMVWSEYLNANYDIYTAHINAANSAGPNQAVSLGAPGQLRPDLAGSGSGYMVVFRSSTGAQHRVMAHPLDANGDPLLAEPVLLDSGDWLNGPGAPSVACGLEWLVVHG